MCSAIFSFFDRQLTFLEISNSNTALSILSCMLLLQGNILEIVKKEMCFAKRTRDGSQRTSAWEALWEARVPGVHSSLEGLAFVRPHGIGWETMKKGLMILRFKIAGTYEPGNATLVSET